MTPKKNTVLLVILSVLLLALAGGAAGCMFLQSDSTLEERETLDFIAEDRPEPAPVYYWPLTGLPANDEGSLYNRPLCIKIENSPESRPQYGISSADVVYETITEGGITRFNCIFQSTIPTDVGPVRSARNSDTTIVPQYQGVLYYSGANTLVLQQMAYAGIDSLTEGAAAGQLFYRVDFRYAPHNLFMDTGNAYALTETEGFVMRVDSPSTLEFLESGSERTNAAIALASYINIPFSTAFIAEWTWDSTTGLYYRSMDGPTLDAATEAQVAVTNLVVMWAPHTYVSAGNGTYEINLNGTGSAMVFSNGQWIEGIWQTDGTTPPRFWDASGEPILLAPGQSWFSVVEDGTVVSAS